MQARCLTAAALLVLAAACATTWTVDKYEAPEAGLANRRTYAWKGGEIGLPNDVDPALLARADQAVRVAVEGELARKGYTPTEAGSADMLVSYQVAGQRRFVISNDRPVGASAATEAMTPGSTPAPPSTPLVAARIWSGTGEVKTSPQQAASSMPGPTNPPCKGSWPEPPPETSPTFPGRGGSARNTTLFS